MPISTSILDYLRYDTHANRPASPPVGTATAVYYETDTTNTFVWSGSAWVQVNGGGGGSGLASVGTSFPGSPSTGALCFRTDLLKCYCYCGTAAALFTQQSSDGATHVWKMNEASGTSATDSIGTATGTYTSCILGTDVAYTSDQTWATGFNGSNSHMNTSINDPNGTGDFTLEMIFAIANSSQSNGQRMIANDHTDSNGNGLQVRLGATGLGVDIGGNGNSATYNFVVGKAYMLHVVYDSTAHTYAAYINNAQVLSGSGTYHVAASALSVGYNPSYSGDWWPGICQSLAVYPSQLTGAQRGNHSASLAGGWQPT